MNRRNINEADPELKNFIEDHLGFIKSNIREFCEIKNIDEVWLNGLLIFLANQDLSHSFINIDKEKIIKAGLSDEFEYLERKRQNNIFLSTHDDWNYLVCFLQNLANKVMYGNENSIFTKNIDEAMKSFRKYFSKFKIRMIIIFAEPGDRNYRFIEMASHSENVVFLVILGNKIVFLILNLFEQPIMNLDDNFKNKTQEISAITLSCGCKIENFHKLNDKCPKCKSVLYKYEIELLMKTLTTNKTEARAAVKTNKDDSYLKFESKNSLEKQDNKPIKRASSAHRPESHAAYILSPKYSKNDLNNKENGDKANNKRGTREGSYNINDSKKNRSNSLEPKNRNNPKALTSKLFKDEVENKHVKLERSPDQAQAEMKPPNDITKLIDDKIMSQKIYDQFSSGKLKVFSPSSQKLKISPVKVIYPANRVIKQNEKIRSETPNNIEQKSKSNSVKSKDGSSANNRATSCCDANKASENNLPSKDNALLRRSLTPGQEQTSKVSAEKLYQNKGYSLASKFCQKNRK